MRRTLALAAVLLAALPRPLPAQCSPQVLVAYYSQSGHTRVMAESVAAGARAVPGTRVTLASVEAVDSTRLHDADAVVVGSPVHDANVAVPVLQFIRRWPFPDGMRDKVGAAFVTGGGMSSGEEEVQLSILRAMLIYSMVVVGGGEWREPFGASAVTGEAPWDSLPAGRVAPPFLAKARLLGTRVATLARRLRCR
jgi:NAD(P)H dehydrogenase (quinone)